MLELETLQQLVRIHERRLLARKLRASRLNHQIQVSRQEESRLRHQHQQISDQRSALHWQHSTGRALTVDDIHQMQQQRDTLSRHIQQSAGQLQACQACLQQTEDNLAAVNNDITRRQLKLDVLQDKQRHLRLLRITR